jgi:hypothetical protein
MTYWPSETTDYIALGIGLASGLGLELASNASAF